MKKASYLIFALIFALSFASCGVGGREEYLDEYSEIFSEEAVIEERSSDENITTEAEAQTKETTTALSTTEAATEKAAAAETTEASRSTAANVTSAPKAAESTASEKKSDTVFFTIDCRTVLDNKDALKAGKEYFVPDSGVIFPKTEIDISDGDTVFDILKKACNDNNIQIEYTYSSGFGSYYIEGINQLYEKDCGAFSGWTYRVNGELPSVGASKYEVKNGDNVEFLYTCDMGDDLL